MARYTDQSAAFAVAKAPSYFSRGPSACLIVARSRSATSPGQHGKDRKAKIVGYGLQLHEKQKAKRMYFTLEGQFREYYEKANAPQALPANC